MPLISVVIPAYNYAALLPRALDSVLSQSADAVEIIVVNDGSTDDTPAVLAEYQKQCKHLVVIHQANGGAAAARNTGAEAARGKYLLMLDADDELVPGAVEEMLASIGRHPQAGMIVGGGINVRVDGKECTRIPRALPEKEGVELAREYLLRKTISISHGCTLFRRDLMLQCPYPEHLRNSEDIAVFAYFLVAAPVAVLPKPLVRIYKHRDSLRHQRSVEQPDAIVEAVFAHLPATCEPLRKPYLAQRYLSLFRAHVTNNDRALAKSHYALALRLSARQALRWTYLRKALRLWAKPGG